MKVYANSIYNLRIKKVPKSGGIWHLICNKVIIPML